MFYKKKTFLVKKLQVLLKKVATKQALVDNTNNLVPVCGTSWK